MSAFAPLLTTADWGEEWKQLQRARRAADDASHWDERSKTFKQADSPSSYTEAFFDYAGIRPGESALDMGCGTGALAIPLAMEGHEVVAADFSKGMLSRVREDCERLGLDDVRTVLMGWEDDWSAHGVCRKSVDVALASRSIATADLEESIKKLSSTARRRCCVTLSTGSSPRVDERAMEAIGLQGRLGRDYAYAFMILVGLGYRPEVRYIPSVRTDTFASREEALESFERMAREAAGSLTAEGDLEAAVRKLPAWLDENLVANPQAGEPDGRGGVQGAFTLRLPRTITWAFIAWDVEG